MTVVISLLRGVNLASYNRIDMSALRALYESLGLRDAQTYVQSGNVIFRAEARDVHGLPARIEKEIDRRFGIRTDIILRTSSELRDVVARNPFAGRRDMDPRKLLVTFLAGDPDAEGRKKVLAIKAEPEEFYIDGREVYIYYANGLARPKLSWSAIAKSLKTPGTGRNWNSVTRMLEMAQRLEDSP